MDRIVFIIGFPVSEQRLAAAANLVTRFLSRTKKSRGGNERRPGNGLIEVIDTVNRGAGGG